MDLIRFLMDSSATFGLRIWLKGVARVSSLRFYLRICVRDQLIIKNKYDKRWTKERKEGAKPLNHP